MAIHLPYTGWVPFAMRFVPKIGLSKLLLGVLLQAGGLGWLGAATLERLSLEDMVSKSTGIVRARVASSYVAPSGSIIYTHYTVQVSEQWKGTPAASLDVVVAGGQYGGIRQVFPGAPVLTTGSEYILFLWKSRSGLTHIIGLTQGLFGLQRDKNGELVAKRAATTELMLDSNGRAVRDVALSLRLSDLKQRVNLAMAQGSSR